MCRRKAKEYGRYNCCDCDRTRRGRNRSRSNQRRKIKRNSRKDFFEKKGYSIYVKEINLPSSNFTEVLKQYDLLLERTDDENAIEAINASILSEYEEAYGEN